MTEWIIAISSSITALTVIVLWKQITANHELSRRDRAVSLIQFWASNLTQKQSYARNFAENLNFEQSKCLFNRESFTIDAKNINILSSGFEISMDSDRRNQDGKITLGEKEVTEIKIELVNFLNMLEAILSAWRHNVADRDILKEEFHFLVLPEEGHDILKNFRKAAGGKASCPSIEEFVEHIEKDQSRRRLKAKKATP